MILPVTVTVYEPMYDYNEKKYIRTIKTYETLKIEKKK